ncbi:hypothetical protein [Agarivorans litoreus]|nr:hypothetical protein [Agarivorans litoreus]
MRLSSLALALPLILSSGHSQADFFEQFVDLATAVWMQANG